MHHTVNPSPTQYLLESLCAYGGCPVVPLTEKREGPERPYGVVDRGAMRTSENAQKAKFVEFYKSEVQLRRIPIPRTPVNKGKRKGGGQLTMALQMLPVRVGVRFFRLAYAGVSRTRRVVVDTPVNK